MDELYWGYWDGGSRPQPCSIPLVSPLQYTADFQKRLGDFSARLGDVRLLRSEGRQDLETFARSGIDEVDYGRFQEEVRGRSWGAGPCCSGQDAATHTGAGFQGWILGSCQLHLLPDEKPRGADQPPWLGEEPRGAAENAGERRGGRWGLPVCLQGRPHPIVPLQRNGTVAGRLAAEAQALWQMQNSTVQSQEALVVSPCRAGGSRCCQCLLSGVPMKWGTGLWKPSHLSVPQAKLGESVQFLSRLAPHLQVLAWFFLALKNMWYPTGPACQGPKMPATG